MSINIYVGNLPYSVKDDDLQGLFAKYGEIRSAKVITMMDGKSKGFGFVEMESEDDGLKAIDELNQQMVGERQIVVNKARPKENRGDRRPRKFNGGGKKA